MRSQARRLGISFIPYRIARKKWSEPLAKNTQDPGAEDGRRAEKWDRLGRLTVT